MVDLITTPHTATTLLWLVFSAKVKLRPQYNWYNKQFLISLAAFARIPLFCTFSRNVLTWTFSSSCCPSSCVPKANNAVRMRNPTLGKWLVLRDCVASRVYSCYILKQDQRDLFNVLGGSPPGSLREMLNLPQLNGNASPLVYCLCGWGRQVLPTRQRQTPQKGLWAEASTEKHETYYGSQRPGNQAQRKLCSLGVTHQDSCKMVRVFVQFYHSCANTSTMQRTTHRICVFLSSQHGNRLYSGLTLL